MRRFIGRWGSVALLLALLGGTAPASADDLPSYDIVVVGGEKAISRGVFAALEAMTSGSVIRVSGSDRYATAAAVSEAASEPGVPVVFVATGADFPDALVAGPVAARQGGSVLLVERDRVPQPTRDELARLQPQRVIALGGKQAISQAVLDELAALAGVPVDVLHGPTRFSTAAAVSRSRFSPGVARVYIATGLEFADALTTVPAAAVADSPILLVGKTVLPPSTREELERLQPEGIVVVGGTNAVGEAVFEELEGYTSGPVERVAGPGREATAARVSEHAFPAGAGIVFIATGATFPDALAIGAAAGAEPHRRFALLGAGGSAAGETPGPVLLSRLDSLPDETIAELERLGRAVPAPLAQDQAVETDFQTPVGITLTATGSGGPPFTFDVTAPPQHGTLSGTPPDLTYTPDAGFTGTDTFEFAASIGAITSAPATVTITVHPPDTPVAHDQAVSTQFETPAGITLTGSAPSGLPLTFAIATPPADGTLSGTPPNVTYTPGAGFHGTDTFTFTVSDGIDTSAPATVTVTVFPEPPQAQDVSATTDQEAAVVVTLDGHSPSGQPLTYHYQQPSDGTVTGAGPDVTYTPDPGFHGTDTFTYHVNDGFNDSNTATVTVTVDPLPPVAHDQAVGTAKNAPVVITLQADNPSGGTLTYDYQQPADGTVTGTGPDVTYTPDLDFEGTDSFTFHVNDGFNDSNTATVTIAVEPQAPEAHDMPGEETDQDTPVVITLDATNHSANPLTYHYTQPADGTVTGAGPDVTYTPDPGFHGTDTFTFHVNDGFNDSNTATVTVTVNPAPPVAEDQSVSTAFETAVVITLGAQNPSGGPLTFHYQQPADGTVTGAGPDVTYTPDPGFHGTDSFTFHVNDTFNDSNTATVTVTVEPPPPVAHDVSASTDQDTPVVITLDADNFSANPLTYHYQQPADGTVTGAGPDVTYTPDPGFFGEDTFTFHVNDGFNDSNTATVTVTVSFAAEDYDFDTVGNTLLEVGVAASGDPAVTVAASLLDDAPSVDFEVVAVDTSGSSGEVGWNADGTFAYEPEAGFTGDDTFVYTISDGTFSGSGTVTVTVSDLVWYVDAGASGDGRSWSPFGTLAAAEAASGTGDIVFVYEGTYDDGITLKADQQLLGEEAGLTVGGHDLVDPGDRPSVAAASDDAITLAPGVHVEGIDVTGAPGRGLVADDAGGTMTVIDVDVSGVTGNAVHLTGSGDVSLSSVNITNAAGQAVALLGLSGDVTHTGTITQSGTAAAVAVQDLTASADVSLGPVTSAASGITVSDSAGTVVITSATLGSAGGRISGQPGLSVSGGSGTVTVTTLTAYTQGAPAVQATGAGTVNVGSGVADAQGAPGLALTDSAAGVTLTTMNSSGSTTTGLALSNVTGTVTIPGGAITGSTGHAVHVDGGSVGLTTGASITNASGNGVRVTGLSGGSVQLSGAVTDTGSGINLTNNTGSTVAFTGVLDVTTNGSTAFAATGGGTVTATAAGSTLSATGARGLQVTSTTIGAAGLRFAAISASGSVHGIEVSSAGSGALTVDGDGSADRNGSGGVISGMSSHGVTLSGAGPVTLRNMTIEDNDHVGVRAQNLGGLSLHALHLEGNTSDQANPATRNSVWLRNVMGQVRLNDSYVTSSAHNQVDIENSAGTVAVEVARTTLEDNGSNSGLQAEAVGTATMTLTVDDSTFADHHATGVHAFARNSANLTVTVTGSTFTGNNVAVNLAAQHTATITSTVTGNTISGHASHSINVTVHEDATHDAVVTGNTLDTTATSASVGIRLVAEDDSLLRARVEGNTVSGQTSGHGFRMLARDDAGSVHLVLRDNSVTTTSSSPAYSIEPLHESYLCAAISGNTGSSSHPSRDLLVDLFDAGARGDFEGAPVGPITEAQLEAHLEAQNPGPRIGAFIDSNAFGVAADTCQRP